MPDFQMPPDGLVVIDSEVREEWLDYNDHMNVAYYVAAFDLGVEAVKQWCGITEASRAADGLSTVALEAHITYQNEAARGERLRIVTRVLACDAKRIHWGQEMWRDGVLLSTQETLSISFDLKARRSAPFGPGVGVRFAALRDAQRARGVPGWVGRKVALGQAKPLT
jgi:acyl-CoA thioester hydrolase